MSVGRLFASSIVAVMAMSVSCQSTVDMTSCPQNNAYVAMMTKDECKQQILLLQQLKQQVDRCSSSLKSQQIDERQTLMLQSLIRDALELNDTSEHLRSVGGKQERQLHILQEMGRQQLQHAGDLRNTSQSLDYLQQQQHYHFNQTSQRLDRQEVLLEDVKHQQALEQNTSSRHRTMMLQQLARDAENSSLHLQQVERRQEQQQLLLQQLQQQLNNVTDTLLRMRRESECPGELSDNFQLRFSRTVVVVRSRQQLVTKLADCCTPLLIQQNVDGSNFFDRTWNEFRAGFSGSNGNYWLGNELLHQLTKDGRYKLVFDLQSRDNSQWYWAEYSTFIVHNESTAYRLEIGGFTGNVQYDAVGGHDLNGMNFTTKDRDNDLKFSVNCAIDRGGGFWYNDCSYCGVNNMRSRGYDFRWYKLYNDNVLLQTSRMWLMCR